MSGSISIEREPLVTVDTANQTGDAFGRFRVSEPDTLFDSKQIHDNQPLFWDDQEVSGGSTTSTFSANRASSVIAVANTTAGKRVRQTFQSFNYQPGKSQLILMTGILGAAATGITREMGLGDDENGVFLRTVEGVVNLTIRSFATGSAVDTDVAQANWDDPFDGTGASGVTLDWTKTQILQIDFEWLGVGTVRFAFVVDGKIYTAHTFKNANTLGVVYMSKPNLPLRYSIENDGNGAAASLEHICTTVMSEGGKEEKGLVLSTSTAGTHVDADVVNTVYAILGLRLKAAYIGTVVKILQASIQLQTASETGEWRLLLNPTVEDTFTYSDITNSALQKATGATANTVTGGTEIAAGFAQSTSGGGGSGGTSSLIATSRYLGAAIDATVDEIVLCWQPTTGTNQDIEASLTWREL